MARSFSGHLKVQRFFRDVRKGNLAARVPHLLNKYLASYLAVRFGKVIRRTILLDHYEFIAARLVDNFYDLLFFRAPVLWRDDGDKAGCSIVLAFSDHHQEGDLSLLFQHRGITIFVMSFSVIDGALVGAPARHVLLIGRVQGTPSRLSEIRQSTKACIDIAPPYLLLAAIQGVAASLGIDHIAGVSNLEQLVKSAKTSDEFSFDYDVFWETVLAEPTGLGFYVMPVPLMQKPLQAITISHRRRTRRKRTYKENLSKAVKSVFRETLVRKISDDIASLSFSPV